MIAILASRITEKRQTFTPAQGRKFEITCFTVEGTRPGPVLAVIAGQHGMEHSGPNLLPELIEELAQREFAGTVQVCPCANPLALELDYEIYPENEDLSKIDGYYYSPFRHYYCPWGLGREDGDSLYNMNRLWNRPDAPGVAGEVTRYLWREICADANLIVDMHCLQAEKPKIFNSAVKNLDFCRFAGFEAVFMTDPQPDALAAGNLTYQGSTGRHRHAICLEFSRQHGLKESEYELGRQSVRNLMAGMRMTPDEVVLERPVWLFPFRGRGHRFLARHTGHIRYHRALYDAVRKGDRVYTLRSIDTSEILEEGFAPFDGVMGYIPHDPVARPGTALCCVSQVELLAEAHTPLQKLPEDFFRR